VSRAALHSLLGKIEFTFILQYSDFTRLCAFDICQLALNTFLKLRPKFSCLDVSSFFELFGSVNMDSFTSPWPSNAIYRRNVFECLIKEAVLKGGGGSCQGSLKLGCFKLLNKQFVHSVEQKSIGLKFSKSLTESHVKYSCHHKSYYFLHICAFIVFLRLPFITINHITIYQQKTTIRLLNLKLKQ